MVPSFTALCGFEIDSKVHILTVEENAKVPEFNPNINLFKQAHAMNKNIDIQGLLEKPVWQMTGEEYCQLTHYALSLSPNTGSSQAPAGRKALGVHALAEELGCSESTIYALMRTSREEDGSSEGGGVLKPAIVSRIGRRIVFDVDKARELATQSRQR